MKLRYIAFLLLLLVVFTHSCKFSSTKKYNIILIIPDALRARQLPYYGYPAIETPMIDAFAKESVRFEQCYVKRANTYSSFSNLFSGLEFPKDGLLAGEKTMAEFFKEEGYRTMGVVSSSILWSSEQEKGRIKNQFSRGFDDYFQDTSLKKYPYCRKNEPTTKDILDWLEANKKSKTPFFLFAHYMDPHAPYKPSYDGEIEKIDSEFGKVIAKLKELKIYEDSIVIFTSDHGESLGDPVSDHGSPQGHGWIPYNEQHRVPLFIKFPGNKYAESIRQIVRNIDILPTLLDYTGISFEADMFDGKSLCPAIADGEDLKLVSFFHSGSNRVSPESQFAIVFPFKEQLFKFIRGGFSRQIRELYNLSLDPGERNNLVGDARFNKIRDKAVFLIRDYEKRARSQIVNKKKEKVIENPERIEALKALGYIGAGVPSLETRVNRFLMEQDIYPIGALKYHSFIRDPMWGRYGAMDPFFPTKITAAGDDRFYIIGNRDNELYSYKSTERFPERVEEIDGVRDFSFDVKGKRLLLLGKDTIRSLTAAASAGKGFKPDLRKPMSSCHSIYTDNKGNIYLFDKNEVLKLSGRGSVLKRYPLSVDSSNLFAVDKEGNVYAAGKDRISSYDSRGRLLSSFVLSKQAEDVVISAIAVDDKKRTWVLERNSCTVHVFEKGKKMVSFSYNNHRMRRRWKPVPTRHLYVDRDKVFIIDKWEGIFVYKIK